MLELPKDPTRIPGQKVVHRELRIPGLKMWKMNVETKQVEEIMFPKGTDIISDQKGLASTVERNVFVDPKCIYIQALNRKNAERKFAKMLAFVRMKAAYDKVVEQNKPKIIS